LIQQLEANPDLAQPEVNHPSQRDIGGLLTWTWRATRDIGMMEGGLVSPRMDQEQHP
jgi:hypothetical protein